MSLGRSGPVVMDLHELSPVNRRATGGRDGRRFERFAEVCENLTSRGRSHPGLRPRANLRFEVSRLLPAVFSEPDVAAAPRALERKLLPHPGHQLGPGNPRRVVRAGLVIRIRVAASFRGMTVDPMPAGTFVANKNRAGAFRPRRSFRYCRSWRGCIDGRAVARSSRSSRRPSPQG